MFVFTCCHTCVAFVSYSFCICISSAGNSGSPILQLLLPLAILDLWPATPLELGGGADDGENFEDDFVDLLTVIMEKMVIVVRLLKVVVVVKIVMMASNSSGMARLSL